MLSPTVTENEHQRKIGEKLITIIRTILITEREVEELKITLAENIRFDISDAFRAIDSNMKGYITSQDIFRFMCKNGFSVHQKFCDFWIFTWSKGDDKLRYQLFLEFIVPKYDRDAAMQCIVRKLYSETGKYKLSFYLEEFVAKLIYKEIDYLRTIEIDKMNLAQLVEWKFTTVFKYVAGNLPVIDKRCLDQLLNKFEIQSLTQQEYNMFLKRFNRNEDMILQKDEFSDAIFPSKELIKEIQPPRDGFQEYVLNHDQQLDQLLGKDQINDGEDFIFKPEEHKIKLTSTQKDYNIQQEFISKKQQQNETIQNQEIYGPPKVQPTQNKALLMSFKPVQIQQPQQQQQFYQNSIDQSIKASTPIQMKSKHYQSPNEQPSQNQQQDLLQQFERKYNASQMAFSQDNLSGYNNYYYNQNSNLEQSQHVQYNQYVNQPTNAQYILSRQ
ncbi:unnamed protein product [Paramecium primaurelia]|uniref:EF-hand domain-containing protein n=1 Tax=Paramecium primaurelia TaxID=5886 RepID=A0A8S1NT32_PARPR|nr:unnamed protein product [Paramecium primaurelia]